MTRLKAKRKLHQYGKTGNWRFKGLMLAALDSDVTPTDVARAWPNPGSKSDYRFLQHHETRDPESEAGRRWVTEEGDKRHRLLRDFVKGADNTPKYLSSDPTKELENGKLGAHIDDAIPRMLFASSDYEEIDTLFREQLYEVIKEGREINKVAREASDVINPTTRRGDMTIASDEQFAPPMAQGSEIRDDGEDYATVSWDATKHGEGTRITDEMMDQAMIDPIERNVQYIGASLENSINREFLRTLVDNADGNYDTAGTDQGYPALNGAVTEVDKAGFTPNTYLTGAEYRGVLFEDSNLAYANRAGTNEVLRNREEAPIIGDIVGLDMHASSHEHVYEGVDDDEWPATNNTFGFENDGELGAVVYDRNRIHTFIYGPNGNDIEIKDYDDPIRDLQGVNGRVHVDVSFSQQRSAATVQY